MGEAEAEGENSGEGAAGFSQGATRWCTPRDARLKDVENRRETLPLTRVPWASPLEKQRKLERRWGGGFRARWAIVENPWAKGLNMQSRAAIGSGLGVIARGADVAHARSRRKAIAAARVGDTAVRT